MKVELSALGPILKEKSEATNQLMDRLVKEQSQAMEVRQVVEADEAIAKVSFWIFTKALKSLLFLCAKLFFVLLLGEG